MEKNIGLKLQKRIWKERLKSKGQMKERNIWLIDTWRMVKWSRMLTHLAEITTKSSTKENPWIKPQEKKYVDHTRKWSPSKGKKKKRFTSWIHINWIASIKDPLKVILVWDKSLGFFLTRAQLIIYTNWPIFSVWNT